jgi:DNA-binding response OmpR family regulator
MVPVIDGAALIEAMRADPQLAHVPVVIMSSIPEAAVAERSLGHVAFVRKPFNIFSVVELVANLTQSGKGLPKPARDTLAHKTSFADRGRYLARRRLACMLSGHAAAYCERADTNNSSSTHARFAGAPDGIGLMVTAKHGYLR